uniref:Uncharacterized protein n=1 Tax=Magallana gigas TaxID=29159 RepID=A0A8W8HL34_MAGGI
METSVMRRRITPKKVGQYFDSPYPLNDSGIELNTETECRTSWQPTSRVTPESPNFQELGQNSQGPSVQHMYIPKPSLKRILLIWVIFALIGCSLIVMTWIYFPENKIAQKSQENALTSMVSVASAMLLVIILRVVWKYGGPSLLNTNKGGNSLKFIPTDTTFNGGSASIAPTGTYQEPKLSGQSGSTAPNLGNQTPHGIGYNFEFPMADETPTNTPMTTEAGQRTNEYPKINQVTDLCVRLMTGKREVIEQLQILPSPQARVTGTTVSIQIGEPQVPFNMLDQGEGDALTAQGTIAKEESFNLGPVIRAEEIDWTRFFQYLQDEFEEHARARHEGEDQEAEYL